MVTANIPQDAPSGMRASSALSQPVRLIQTGRYSSCQCDRIHGLQCSRRYCDRRYSIRGWWISPGESITVPLQFGTMQSTDVFTFILMKLGSWMDIELLSSPNVIVGPEQYQSVEFTAPDSAQAMILDPLLRHTSSPLNQG